MKKISSMTLELNGLKVDCIIGDRPEERTREQTLLIDVVMSIGTKVAYSDSLDDTVDYVTLSENITKGLKDAKCYMIEKAAYLISQICLANMVVQKVQVRVCKSGTVPGLASATACIEMTQQDNISIMD